MHMSRLNNLYKKMIEYDRGDPKRIQHFIKVHSFARLIGQEEYIDDNTLYILEAAAYVHDIGIHPAMEKYGRDDGKLQEQDVIDRVCYLVGHHHTYTDIKGMDYQILVEADFLVNYFENNLSAETIQKSVEKIFRTETGRRIAEEMFYPKEFEMSETWAQDNIQELDDFIEAQGIYIRQ